MLDTRTLAKAATAVAAAAIRMPFHKTWKPLHQSNDDAARTMIHNTSRILCHRRKLGFSPINGGRGAAARHGKISGRPVPEIPGLRHRENTSSRFQRDSQRSCCDDELCLARCSQHTLQFRARTHGSRREIRIARIPFDDINRGRNEACDFRNACELIWKIDAKETRQTLANVIENDGELVACAHAGRWWTTANVAAAISGCFLYRRDAWLHCELQLIDDATNRRMHNPHNGVRL